MLKSKKTYILLILFLISTLGLNAQMKFETLKAAFIYQFTQNITHLNESSLETYKICFLSEDSAIYREFNRILATSKINNKINGKPVQVYFNEDITDFSDIQLLYVDKSFNSKIENIWKTITKKNIILVTDECIDAKYIMLNLLYIKEEQTISFEVNKANLIIENLQYKPELLLLGGKEVDIRELYEKTKILLENSKDELDESKTELQNKKLLLENQEKQLAVQILESDSLRKDIDFLIKRISSSEGRLNFLTDSIVKQQNILNLKLQQIKLQEDKLHIQNNEINLKEIEIKLQTYKLDSLINESSKQQQTINEQKKVLDTKEILIENQQKNLYSVIIGGFILLIFGIVILTAYIVKKNAASNLENKVNERTKELQTEINERKKTETELELHKNKLELIVKQRTTEIMLKNEELELANEEQKFINNILIEQKHELEITLEKLKDTQNQLIHSEKMASLGILTAGIAHEINNPINFINSGLEGLESILKQITETIRNNKNIIHEKGLNENNNFDFLISGIKKLTKNIQTGVYRTTEIVKSLNTFSRIDEETLVLSDIHKIINSSLILLYNNFKNKIEIIKNFGQIEDFYCYPGKLNQVFVNVIMNSLQAIENKGTIIISTSIAEIENTKEKNNKFVKISVKDNGHGISDEIKNKIFQPFFTTKEVGKGTGLGLSITHGIIELHKGKIEVKSIINEGTEFILFLPLKPSKN